MECICGVSISERDRITYGGNRCEDCYALNMGYQIGVMAPSISERGNRLAWYLNRAMKCSTPNKAK